VEWLNLLLKWFSSGPVGIISGIFGMGALALGVSVFLKKLQKVRFENTLNDAAETAGRGSAEASENMRENTRIIDALSEAEQERMRVPLAIKAPSTVKVCEKFTIKLTVPANGCDLYADDYRLFIIGSGYDFEISLNTPGNRVLKIIRDGKVVAETMVAVVV